MMRTHPVTEGMRVRTADGEKLGRVVLTGERTFQIEKGYFFPKELVARYDDVQTIEDETVVLALTREELVRGMSASTAGAAPPAEPETQAPDDPRERERLEKQLRDNQQRQWASQASVRQTGVQSMAAAPRSGETDSSARVERQSFRVGDVEPIGGTRLRHREYAVGYSEARGEMIAFETELTEEGETHRTERIAPEDMEMGADGIRSRRRRGVAPDMAGASQDDPGEHP